MKSLKMKLQEGLDFQNPKRVKLLGRKAWLRSSVTHQESKPQGMGLEVTFLFQAGIKVKSNEPHKHFEERLEKEKEHASRVLTSMLLQDAIDEVIDLKRWAYMEGYDDEMQERLQRLVDFMQGEVVEPQAQS